MGRADQWHEPGADDTYMSHNPSGIGFRLVTEKSLNLTKLSGDQDKNTTISYMKLSRLMKNFIQTKGA